MTRQEFIDALGAEFMLRTHPRREWLIEQIVILADAYAATRAAEAVEARMDALACGVLGDTP